MSEEIKKNIELDPNTTNYQLIDGSPDFEDFKNTIHGEVQLTVSTEQQEKRATVLKELESKGEILPRDHIMSKTIDSIAMKLNCPKNLLCVCVDTDEELAQVHVSSGIVAISTGFLKNIIRSVNNLAEDHIAFVLAHEIAHSRVDPATSKKRAETIGECCVVTGHFNHAEELYADHFALHQLGKANYLPTAYRDVVAHFTEIDAISTTHPNKLERIRQLEEAISNDDEPILNLTGSLTPVSEELKEYLNEQSAAYARMDSITESSLGELLSELASCDSLTEFCSMYHFYDVQKRLAISLQYESDPEIGNLVERMYSKMLLLSILQDLQLQLAFHRADNTEEKAWLSSFREINGRTLESLSNHHSPFSALVNAGVFSSDETRQGYLAKDFVDALSARKQDGLNIEEKQAVFEDLQKYDQQLSQACREYFAIFRSTHTPEYIRDLRGLTAEHVEKILKGELPEKVFNTRFIKLSQHWQEEQKERKDCEREQKGLRKKMNEVAEGYDLTKGHVRKTLSSRMFPYILEHFIPNSIPDEITIHCKKLLMDLEVSPSLAEKVIDLLLHSTPIHASELDMVELLELLRVFQQVKGEKYRVSPQNAVHKHLQTVEKLIGGGAMSSWKTLIEEEKKKIYELLLQKSIFSHFVDELPEASYVLGKEDILAAVELSKASGYAFRDIQKRMQKACFRFIEVASEEDIEYMRPFFDNIQVMPTYNVGIATLNKVVDMQLWGVRNEASKLGFIYSSVLDLYGRRTYQFFRDKQLDAYHDEFNLLFHHYSSTSLEISNLRSKEFWEDIEDGTKAQREARRKLHAEQVQDLIPLFEKLVAVKDTSEQGERIIKDLKQYLIMLHFIAQQGNVKKTLEQLVHTYTPEGLFSFEFFPKTIYIELARMEKRDRNTLLEQQLLQAYVEHDEGSPSLFDFLRLQDSMDELGISSNDREQYALNVSRKTPSCDLSNRVFGTLQTPLGDLKTLIPYQNAREYLPEIINYMKRIIGTEELLQHQLADVYLRLFEQGIHDFYPASRLLAAEFGKMIVKEFQPKRLSGERNVPIYVSEFDQYNTMAFRSEYFKDCRVLKEFGDIILRRYPYCIRSSTYHTRQIDQLNFSKYIEGSPRQLVLALILYQHEQELLGDGAMRKRIDLLHEVAPFSAPTRDIYIEYMIRDLLGSSQSQKEKYDYGIELYDLFQEDSQLKKLVASQLVELAWKVKTEEFRKYEKGLEIIEHFYPEASLAKNYYLHKLAREVSMKSDEVEQMKKKLLSHALRNEEGDQGPLQFILSSIDELSREERQRMFFWLHGITEEKPLIIRQKESDENGHCNSLPRFFLAMTPPEKAMIIRKLMLGVEGVLDTYFSTEKESDDANQREFYERLLDVVCDEETEDVVRDILMVSFLNMEPIKANTLVTELALLLSGSSTKPPVPEVLYRVLQQFGVVGVKVAQSLSELESLPMQYRQAFRQSQSNAMQLKKTALHTIADAHGLHDTQGELYIEEYQALAGAASNKQACLVRLREGNVTLGDIVAKFKRPSAQKTTNVEKDIDLLKSVVDEVILMHKGFQLPSHFVQVIEETIRRELDFYGEKLFADKFKKNIATKASRTIASVVTPKIIAVYDDVIFETKATGIVLSELLTDENGQERAMPKKVALTVFTELVRELFITGTLHVDLHPGNIFYDEKQNKVTFIDLGMHEYMEKNERKVVLSLLKNLYTGSQKKVAQELKALGCVVTSMMNMKRSDIKGNINLLLGADSSIQLSTKAVSILHALLKFHRFAKELTFGEMMRSAGGAYIMK